MKIRNVLTALLFAAAVFASLAASGTMEENFAPCHSCVTIYGNPGQTGTYCGLSPTSSPGGTFTIGLGGVVTICDLCVGKYYFCLDEGGYQGIAVDGSSGYRIAFHNEKPCPCP